jgi:hypothetical protein
MISSIAGTTPTPLVTIQTTYGASTGQVARPRWTIARVHRDRVYVDQRVLLAGSPTLVRGAVPDRPSPVGQWAKAGLWRKLRQAVLAELGSAGLIDWSRAIVDGASLRAKRGICLKPEPASLRCGSSASSCSPSRSPHLFKGMRGLTPGPALPQRGLGSDQAAPG